MANKQVNVEKNNCTYLRTICRLACFKIKIIECLAPIMQLLVRLAIAPIFFNSGKLKLDDWSTTLLLFESEHPVPFMPKFMADWFGISNHYLPANIAAYSGVTFELLMPVLLVIGLGARGAAFILLCMTAIIEFSYQHSQEHLYWALLLGIIFFQGPGKLSFDHLIRKRYYCYNSCADKNQNLN